MKKIKKFKRSIALNKNSKVKLKATIVPKIVIEDLFVQNKNDGMNGKTDSSK